MSKYDVHIVYALALHLLFDFTVIREKNKLKKIMYGSIKINIYTGVKLGHMKNALVGVVNIAMFKSPTSAFFI